MSGPDVEQTAEPEGTAAKEVLLPEQRAELEEMRAVVREGDFLGTANAAWLIDLVDRLCRGVAAAEERGARAERERIAEELLAVDPIEWALAGQHAGVEAAKVARGEVVTGPETGRRVRVVLHGVTEDWVKEQPNKWRSTSGGGTASDAWINDRLARGEGSLVPDH